MGDWNFKKLLGFFCIINMHRIMNTKIVAFESLPSK